MFILYSLLEGIFFPQVADVRRENAKLRARVRHLKWELSGYKRNLKIESKNVRDWRALAEKTRGELEAAEVHVRDLSAELARARNREADIVREKNGLLMENGQLEKKLQAELMDSGRLATELTSAKHVIADYDALCTRRMGFNERLALGPNWPPNFPVQTNAARHGNLRNRIFNLPDSLSVIALECERATYFDMMLFMCGSQPCMSQEHFEKVLAVLDRLEAAGGSVPAGTPALPGEGV